MKARANSLPKRLHYLEEGDGLRRAAFLSRMLFVVGMLLSVGAGLAIAFQLHPAIVGLAGLAVGYIIAECNALRSRIAQWPNFRNYIDWQRVREDLNRDV
ncbi:MAG TPA: SoxR reducing system RseC family protein [Steroidobacteraceae bacterium]|jgi:hypothetical protein